MTEIPADAQPDEGIPCVPHAPGTKVDEVTVTHPVTGESSIVLLPADRDGSRVKVEFPDGAIAYTSGFDPAAYAAAGARPVAPCGNCGAPQTLTQQSFDCSVCGVRNTIALRTATDAAVATTES